MDSAQGVAPSVLPPAATEGGVERIIIMRHGEKPEAGLGQLACRGLARAIALPDVILAKYGAPKFIFAPNPARRKPDRGTLYDYIRPLATVEPLAIRVGLPVDVQHGFDQHKALVRRLVTDHFAGAFTLVAWEHRFAPDITREILKKFAGDATAVARWKDDDFDRMDVVEITRTPGQPTQAKYIRDRQGLDGISGDCPRLQAK